MIGELVKWEASVVLSSVFWGMILAFVYDLIRVYRRVVIHKKVWLMSLEDIIYWICTGVIVFALTYEMNSGIIRGFQLGSFILGAIIYRYAFGRFFVVMFSKLILFLLKPIKIFYHFIMKYRDGGKNEI